VACVVACVEEVCVSYMCVRRVGTCVWDACVVEEYAGGLCVRQCVCYVCRTGICVCRMGLYESICVYNGTGGS